MIRRLSRTASVTTLIKREFLAYSRDRLFLLLTGLTLVFVAVVFWIAPAEVEDRLTVGISPPLGLLLAGAASIAEEIEMPDLAPGAPLESFPAWEDGLQFVQLERETDLRALLGGDLEAWLQEDGTVSLHHVDGQDAQPGSAERLRPTVGLAFPERFVPRLIAADPELIVRVYTHATVAPEIRAALVSFVREFAYRISGQELPVSLPSEEMMILGPDRAGDQTPIRARLIPLVAFMILLMETLSLSSLISKEVLQRTVTAVLVTPVRVGDFLLAKTLFGTGLAFGQSVLALGLVGAFTGQNWPILMVTLLIGGLMFTAVAMVVGAAGKDFIGQLFYSMLITIPLLIPALAVLFPGSTAAWVRLLPTFPLLDALLGATASREGWGELWAPLSIGAGWVVALYGVGLLTLRRKVICL
jgi:ABC-2 type transport system permease protein